MALDSNTSTAGQNGHVVYYGGPRIVVTSDYIENAVARHAVRDLRLIDRVEVYGHPARTVALICGAIELALAVPLALAFGSAALLCAGFISALGLAVAVLVDGRHNPRWMVLRGIKNGHRITLFSSRDQREFQQVRRAVIRAVEANSAPRP